MKYIEKEIMNEVVNRHLKNFGPLIIEKPDDFFNRWAYNDFSITFLSIKDNLTPLEYNVLLAFYNDNWNMDKITSTYHVRHEEVFVIKDFALDKLASLAVFKKLYMGKEEYDNLINSKRKEMQRILNGGIG